MLRLTSSSAFRFSSLLGNTASRLKFLVSDVAESSTERIPTNNYFITVLDIQGKGDMEGSFQNSRARVKMRANKYVKDGETYLKFERFHLKIQIGKNKLLLKNLFNGDPNLGAIGNQFINENSELFLSEILPGLEKNLAEIFTKTANE